MMANNEPDVRSEISAHTDLSRRKFVGTITKATGLAVFLSQPLLSMAENFFPGEETWTAGAIMDEFIKAVPGAPFEKTVDTLKAGSRDTKVTGIVTAMFATVEVIQKAIDLGSNFIIVHEPTFYNHLDETEWLKNDEVFRYKADLLEKHKIAVWRNHDYIHSYQPDGVFEGVLSVLGWKSFNNGNNRNLINVPAVALKELIAYVKMKLGIEVVRYIGDLSQPCSKILLMPGAAGGRRQIQMMGATKPDVLICGELQEWETAEYVRDARRKGQQLSLIVMGHVPSEEPGSEFMEKWLKEKFPSIKVTHILSKNPFSFL